MWLPCCQVFESVGLFIAVHNISALSVHIHIFCSHMYICLEGMLYLVHRNVHDMALFVCSSPIPQTRASCNSQLNSSIDE